MKSDTGRRGAEQSKGRLIPALFAMWQRAMRHRRAGLPYLPAAGAAQVLHRDFCFKTKTCELHFCSSLTDSPGQMNEREREGKNALNWRASKI